LQTPALRNQARFFSSQKEHAKHRPLLKSFQRQTGGQTWLVSVFDFG
jgi:hypothetical protein